MSQPHVIRLRGPWACEVSGQGVRYSRRFNCPTNLEPRDRVWLTFEGGSHPASVRLNDHPLGQLAAGKPAQFDVTNQLVSHNVLAVDVAEPVAGQAPSGRVDAPTGLVGEVCCSILPEP